MTQLPTGVSVDDDARDGMLVLSLTSGLGPTLINRCIQFLGSPQAVLDAQISQLAAVRGIGHKRAQSIRRSIDALGDGKAVGIEKQMIDAYGATVLTIADARYPRLLKHIPDPPPLLYVRGRLQEDDALALAVVGTRRCTAYGREQADRLSALGAQAGLCIVSGGARGVDAAAHRAALRVGGRTLAVLGSGLAKPYPPEHEPLFNEIAAGGADASRGAVISELPMSAPPLAEHFPRRNRIVSGLSLGVLVIEAPVGSGAMITARLAAEEHGRDVMAVPGRVDSRSSTGCHKMIREGWATLVTSIADCLDALGEAGQLLKVGLSERPERSSQSRGSAASVAGLTDTQRRLFEALDQPCTIDQLSSNTGLAVSTIWADITVLEIRGLVVRDRGLCQKRGDRSNVSVCL